MNVPRSCWRFIKLEGLLYLSLGYWIARRRRKMREDERPVGYAQLVGPLMGLWIFASAVEIPIVHVLIPWEVPRLVLLGLGVWGLLWMIGMLASIYVHPHAVTDDRIRVRYGATIDVPIARAEIRQVHATEIAWPSSIRNVQTDGSRVAVAVSGRTNLLLELDAPRELTLGHHTVFATEVALWVDEPRNLARELVASSTT